MANALPALLSFIVMLGVSFAALGGIFQLTKTTAETSAATADSRITESEAFLSYVSSSGTNLSGAHLVEMVIHNQGRISYAKLEKWDVNVVYTTVNGELEQEWLPYADSLSDDTWAVEGIYLDAEASAQEVREPGVVNPQEYLRLESRVVPGSELGSTGRIVVTANDGVVISGFFEG